MHIKMKHGPAYRHESKHSTAVAVTDAAWAPNAIYSPANNIHNMSVQQDGKQNFVLAENTDHIWEFGRY